jgi:ABC-type glutathione transport system ATPase component
MSAPDAMIEVRDLQVRFGERTVVQVAELAVGRGEIVGLAGESGSGKSTVGLALLGLSHTVGADASGSVQFEGRELVGMSERDLRELRGRRIALVMQSPRESLTPTMRLGRLFERTLRLHGVERGEARVRIAEGIAAVRLEAEVLERYPHQISGGQAQRFAIALAVALRADLLVADEPTSALDVTVQAEVVELLRRVRDEHGTGMLFISHDLAVIGALADRVAVMRRGEIVEAGPSGQVLAAPTHPYTQELIAAVPSIGKERA